MNKIIYDGTYIRRLSEALSRNASLIQHWNIATGMKLEQDGIYESGDDKYWGYLKYWVKEDKAYYDMFKDQLQKQCPDIFKSMKRTRTSSTYFKDVKQSYYKVELSNFSFTLSLEPWSGRGGVVFHPKIYCYRLDKVVNLYINDSIEKFIEWLVKENAEMPALREEWDQLCMDLRKRIMGNTLDEIIVKATMDELLADVNADYSVNTGFNDHGRYLEMSCPSLDILLHIPGGYADWKKTVELFADIVKNRMSNS